jgi:hypothetical protein
MWKNNFWPCAVWNLQLGKKKFLVLGNGENLMIAKQQRMQMEYKYTLSLPFNTFWSSNFRSLSLKNLFWNHSNITIICIFLLIFTAQIQCKWYTSIIITCYSSDHCQDSLKTLDLLRGNASWVVPMSVYSVCSRRQLLTQITVIPIGNWYIYLCMCTVNYSTILY